MNIAHQRRTLFRELALALGVALEKLVEFPLLGDAVDAHVNDGSAGLYKVWGDEAGASHGGDDNIARPTNPGQIARLGVADGDRGILVEQQHGNGFPHDVAAAHHHRVLPLYGNAAALQDLNAACRGAGHQARTLSGKIADIHGMEAIHIFFRRNRQ